VLLPGEAGPDSAGPAGPADGWRGRDSRPARPAGCRPTPGRFGHRADSGRVALPGSCGRCRGLGRRKANRLWEGVRIGVLRAVSDVRARSPPNLKYFKLAKTKSPSTLCRGAFWGL